MSVWDPGARVKRRHGNDPDLGTVDSSGAGCVCVVWDDGGITMDDGADLLCVDESGGSPGGGAQ